MTQPCCEAKVQMVLEMGHLPFKEADRTYLMTLNEERVDELLAIEAAVIPQTNEDGQGVTAEMVKEMLANELADPDKLMDMLPPENREYLDYGKRELEAKKATLRAAIVTNTSGAYSEEDVKEMEMEALEKLHEATKPKNEPDYSLNSIQTQTDSDEKLLPAGVGSDT